MPQFVPFNPRHLDGVVRLCAAEGWPSWTHENTAQALAAPGVIAVVAEENDGVLGVAELLTDGRVMAYLGLLVVAKGARRRGIGGALIRDLFDRSGLRRIDLLSEQESSAFYESMPQRPSLAIASTTTESEGSGDIPERWPSRGRAQALPYACAHLLGCCRAEGALRMQCHRVRGLGRVRRRAQLPLLELSCGDRLGILALWRDRAREAEGEEGCWLLDGDRRCRREPPMRCGECGSLLYWTVRDGTYVRVAYGSLIDEPALKPTAHIFVGSKASWHEILDDLPQHDEYPWS